ncbi:pilus assembly PilX N-terminal domain-containing protein [Halonatronum saccharophilum]|uniref:pilus assembly PilX N-terminal domain-containing protein n=1 Tax=Halonatronum saccharophilum TaxID=150060 RepID=UPI0004878C16|nr:pilus assembly PilX N-terminal domain-containing protein [Halonatronum saccharophilum]
MKEAWQGEKGGALVLAMILLLVIPILAMASVQYSRSALQISRFNKERNQAYYLARAGTEAVIAAWHKYDINNKPQGQISTLYFTKDNQFVLEDPGEDKVAKVDVKVEDKGEDGTVFEANAQVGLYRDTVTATVGPYIDTKNLNPPWYEDGYYEWVSGFLGIGGNWEYRNGIIIPGPNIEEIRYEGNTYIFKYHQPVYGIAEVGTSGETIELNNNNDQNKVAYVAQTIFFKSNLDLRQDTEFSRRNGALIVSAEKITFEGDIQIRKGTFSSGDLALHLPSGLGIKLKGREGSYGKVYFSQGVRRQSKGVRRQLRRDIPAGAYYFKAPTGAEAINLLDVYLDSNGVGRLGGSRGEEVLIPIPDDDPNRFQPDPREDIWVIWN